MNQQLNPDGKAVEEQKSWKHKLAQKGLSIRQNEFANWELFSESSGVIATSSHAGPLWKAYREVIFSEGDALRAHSLGVTVSGWVEAMKETRSFHDSIEPQTRVEEREEIFDPEKYRATVFAEEMKRFTATYSEPKGI